MIKYEYEYDYEYEYEQRLDHEGWHHWHLLFLIS